MEYKRCTRCVMDNSYDDTIRFNENGECSYCSNAIKQARYTYYPNVEGETKLKRLIAEIKLKGKNKKYDCVMGISGGLDSSYLAFLGYKWGLRVLAIHIDDSFDTDVSKSNIQQLIKACGFDYKVVKPDTHQFNALTKAYLKSGVANVAVPQDNILFAELYRLVRYYKIDYFLSGGNFSLESILSIQNTHSAYDVTNIKDIASKYCESEIHNLHFISSIQRLILKRLYGIKTVYPLNYVKYERKIALDELAKFCDFKYYGSKHLENKLTAFIQLYWFTHKFHEDKRLAHYSSMIVSGQMTRDEAIIRLREPVYNEEMMSEYIGEIKDKLNISDDEFEQIMKAPIHKHSDYKTERRNIIFTIISMISKFRAYSSQKR